MKKTDQLLWIFLVAAAILWMAGCGKEKDCPESRAEVRGPLTDELVSKIPYTGWETLKFYNDKGDTVRMQGQNGRVIVQSRKEIYNGEGCSSGYAFYQGEVLDFLSNNYSLLAHITLYTKTKDDKLGDNVFVLSIGTPVAMTIDGLRNENYTDTVVVKGNKHYTKMLVNSAGVKAYYNHTEGVVKIIYPGGTNWYRKF